MKLIKQYLIYGGISIFIFIATLFIYFHFKNSTLVSDNDLKPIVPFFENTTTETYEGFKFDDNNSDIYDHANDNLDKTITPKEQNI